MLDQGKHPRHWDPIGWDEWTNNQEVTLPTQHHDTASPQHKGLADVNGPASRTNAD
jgi:hypothetical protein